MKRAFAAAAFACSMAIGASAHAATIATWGSTVDDGNLEGTAVSNATSVVDSVQGSGLVGATTAPGNDVVSPETTQLGGEIAYATAASGSVDDTGTAADAIADSQSYQFTFTVSGLVGGDTLDLSSFAYSVWRNTNNSVTPVRAGWHSSQLAWRVNDTAFTTADLIGSVHVTSTFAVVHLVSDVTGLPTGLENGDVVNFRVYAWGSDNAGAVSDFFGTSRLGAVSIQGTVVEAPIVVPAPAALPAGLALLGLIAARRRRLA